MLLSNTKSNLYAKVKEPNAFALFLVNCPDIYETKITDQSTLKGQMKKIAFCCFSLFLISACQRDKIDIQDTGRKIVINGLITSDSLLNVRLSKSFYYNSNQAYVGSDSLNNARVFFYSNNTCIDSLHLVSDYRPTDMDFFYHSNYWSDRTLPLPGKEYKIVVKAPGYPDATASITVPNLVKLEKLDTSRILVAPDPNFPDLSNIRFKCQISFSDPSYETNYYLISVSKISWREWWTEKLDIRITSQDPLIEEKLARFNDVYGIVFSDKVFNGEKCSLQFIIDANEIGMPFVENTWQSGGKPIAFYKTVVYFKLYSISEEYFWYIKTLNLYNKNFGNPLTEPVMIYSNIKDGYGIFTAAAVSSDSLVFLPSK